MPSAPTEYGALTARQDTAQMPLEPYARFAREVEAAKQRSCMELFAANRGAFQIKKEKTIGKNLERIFAAALRISNKKGFNAMSMRELSREARLSIGALYNYFESKDALLRMLQQQRRAITGRILHAAVAAETEPLGKLQAAVKTHLYLSEAMQPWFYFSYMEAKNFGPEERRAAVQGELNTDRLFTEILRDGRTRGVFCTQNCRMTASFIKAMLQDWYLKRPKYARRCVGVEAYAEFLLSFLEKSLGCR
jgi:AcrR family transcriptional regulator